MEEGNFGGELSDDLFQPSLESRKLTRKAVSAAKSGWLPDDPTEVLPENNTATSTHCPLK